MRSKIDLEFTIAGIKAEQLHTHVTCDNCAQHEAAFESIVWGHNVNICSPECLAVICDVWAPETPWQAFKRVIRRTLRQYNFAH